MTQFTRESAEGSSILLAPAALRAEAKLLLDHMDKCQFCMNGCAKGDRLRWKVQILQQKVWNTELTQRLDNA